jgi:hypothetical protein
MHAQQRIRFPLPTSPHSLSLLLQHAYCISLKASPPLYGVRWHRIMFLQSPSFSYAASTNHVLPIRPALQLSRTWLEVARKHDHSPTPACSCHPHESPAQPLSILILLQTRPAPGPESHLPQPQSWPSMTIPIGRVPPKRGPRETDRLHCHGDHPNEGHRNLDAFTMAPKMETGEAEAVPRVGSKWVRWVGCGTIIAVG